MASTSRTAKPGASRNARNKSKSVVEFEKSSEAGGQSKKEWSVIRTSSDLFMKTETLDQLQIKSNEKTLSLIRMLVEKDELHRSFYGETRELQRIAHGHIMRDSYEEEMLNSELEQKKRLLDAWSKELDKRETLIERVWQKKDKEKNDLINNALLSASMEQRKADEKVLRLVEEQKREKGKLLKRILELEKNLDEKQKLEMEIKELKGKLEVGGDDYAAIQRKMDRMKEKLLEKENDLDSLEQLNEKLIVKERKSNDELQDARRELIAGWKDIPSSSQVNIGMKRMGEIDVNAFRNACKLRFSPDEAEFKAIKLCSLWQEKLKNHKWHPFRVFEDDEGNVQSVLDDLDDDELLEGLKDEWGDEVYEAVATALKELQEYNPCGRYVVHELWNFKENRKATLKEVVSCIFAEFKSLKRKRT